MRDRDVTFDRPRRATPDRANPAIGQPHWWQWPTVLSLDAAVVAVLWQWLAARAARAPLGWPQTSVLGASVWLAYAADRWIEGWRLDPDDIRTERHHFAQQWRWPLAACWAIVLAVDVTVAGVWLAPRELGMGGALVAMVLAYVLSHQFVHRHRRWRAPKEVCIAALLTGGVAIFPITPGNASPLALPLALFGLLCFGNCALISAWERDVDRTHGQTSLTLQFRLGGRLSRWLPWGVAAMAAVVYGVGQESARDAAACAVGSSLLLGGVDVAEPRVGRKLARVLADVALMTPLVVLYHHS